MSWRQYWPKSKRMKIGLTFVGLTIVILWMTSGVFQWSELNCQHIEIDINTGKTREIQYLLYFPISETVKDTWLSQKINKTDAKPSWQRVNTFSPGARYSPHYIYHSAIHQVNSIADLSELVTITPQAQAIIAQTILEKWQDGSDYTAGQYVQKVMALSINLQTITMNDLPTTDVNPASSQSQQ